MINFAIQAEKLGSYVSHFNDLAKGLNVGMLENKSSGNFIDAIIGAGPFNRAVLSKPSDPATKVAEKTILYGEELLKARAKPAADHHGLFAVLAAAHHPLLGFTQRLLVDLGKQGYACHVEHEGKKIAIPLHQLHISFDGDGRIHTTSAHTYHSADDTPVTLPAQTVLLDNVYAEGFRKVETGSVNCTMTDSHGKPLANDLVTSLLWLGVVAQGKNIFRKGTPKAEVLGDLGVDDMERANEFMIGAAKELHDAHGYDPAPLWGQVLASGRGKLMPHLESLAIVREAITLSDIAKQHNCGSYHVSTIDDLLKFFDVKLPELTEAQKKTAADLVEGIKQSPRRATNLEMLVQSLRGEAQRFFRFDCAFIQRAA